MLFNSYVFILLFLPTTVVLFHLLRHRGLGRAAIFSLVAASFLFYAWWSVQYLFLLLGLMGTDLAVARRITRWRDRRPRRAKAYLVLGVAVNLGALGYYKYANFFVDNVNGLLGLDLFLHTIVLPIGISFFTFQKVAFLIDLYQHKVDRFHPLDYALFVTFFPQLIAGPIVHHSEVMPQFARLARVTRADIALGITIFVIGLSKKVLLADNAAVYASPQFDAVLAGTHLDQLSAWSAVLAYTAQIYFDFSAYSDMAIGIGLMFGIRLPVNFDSPYKSRSIVEFWRRWHITLSRFLRDYLYIPLGGNRRGPSRRYVNLYLTMVLGGIWHGAGWTFLIWGALHGIYLIVNHAWHAAVRRLSLEGLTASRPFRLFAWGLTFLAVVLSWVFFRAANLDTALDILVSLAGGHGLGAPISPLALAVPVGLLLLAFFLPNTQEITRYVGPQGTYGTHLPERSAQALAWAPSALWSVSVGVLLALCLMSLSRVSEFIYFQF
jgi:D-alanyl-lipoteichoic acid acyltransferase DltB (MBOAT superfamily)